MTPQEQQLVADLFDRLASLEGEVRDPDTAHIAIEAALTGLAVGVLVAVGQ